MDYLLKILKYDISNGLNKMYQNKGKYKRKNSG